MPESDMNRRMTALKGISEILWNPGQDLPEEAISFKTLFGREKMDVCQVNEDRLIQIVSKMLPILKEFDQRNIFPGLYDLDDWYVVFQGASCQVFLTHPERFQFEESEQDYEWYPEDERLLGDEIFFNRDCQKVADDRLLYKVLVASVRGNVKIPPAATELDYSQDLFRHLSKPFKEHFESGEAWTLEEWERAISSRYSGARLHKHDAKETINEGEQIKTGEVNYRLYVLLRSDFDHSFEMSQMLYEQMDADETEQNRRGTEDRIAFVYGNRAVQLREWAAYPEHFRIQLENKIHSYSSSEALLIACDYMEESLSNLLNTTTGNAGSFCMTILVEHRLSNDRLFQIAMDRLWALSKRGLIIKVKKTSDSEGEAVWRLEHVCK